MASLEHDIAELESNLRSARVERDALKNENAALRTANELISAEKTYLTARLEVEVRANEKAMTLLEMQSADLVMGLRAIKAANASRTRALQETAMGVGGDDASPVAPKQAPFARSMPAVPGKPTAEYFGDGMPQNIDRGEMRVGTTYENRETGDVYAVQPDYSWACIWFNNPTASRDMNVAMGFAPEAKPAQRPIRQGVEQDEWDANNRTPKAARIDQTLADRDARIPRMRLPGLDTDDDRQALGELAETVLRRTR